MRESLYQLPVIGYLVKWLALQLRLPVRIEQIYARQDHMETWQLDLARLAGRVEEQKAELAALRQQLAELDSDLQGAKRQQRAAISAMAPSASPGKSAEPAGAANLDLYYLEFENKFRGSEAMVAERLKGYQPFIDELVRSGKQLPAMDLGCGRGEWLSLLKQNGIKATGVDLNTLMIEHCKAKSLDVTYGDALAALKAVPDGSLMLVSGFHIVEHLSFSDLMSLLEEAYRCLCIGGLAIFETPNPESLHVSMHNFYVDPTHKSPIPPVSLEFMLERSGFKHIDGLRFNVPPPGDAAEEAAVDRLPGSLKGPLRAGTDYALVARKGMRAAASPK